MARYTAPVDTSGITLSSGFHLTVDGIVEVPDELTDGDRNGLAANGFRLAPAEEPKKAPPVKDPPVTE